jgi:AraC-like DNA-binding protein
VLSVRDAEAARQLVSDHAPMLMVLWERRDHGGWAQYANLCRGLGGRDDGACRVILVAQQAESTGVLHVEPRRIVAIFQEPYRLHELASRIAATIPGPDLATLRFSPQVATAIEHVRERYQGRCSLGEIAASLGTAPGYLVRLVRQELGMTWRRFVRSVRVELVKESYGCSEATSIEALAELAGFSDASHLCRVFRRMVGTSPRQYRLTMVGSSIRAVE